MQRETEYFAGDTAEGQPIWTQNQTEAAVAALFYEGTVPQRVEIKSGVGPELASILLHAAADLPVRTVTEFTHAETTE